MNNVKPVVEVTPEAKEYIKGVLTKHDKRLLFLGIKGGGCAGFEYYWEIITPEDWDLLGSSEKDETISLGDGHRLIVDHLSIMYLLGSVVDYEVDITGSRLVVKNPKAVSGCGCGASVGFGE
jgi:iron-sulfur cluster insertion protein